MEKPPLLQFEDWTLAFPRAAGGLRPVVDHLSFELAAGQTLGIVGESGSGKSLTALSVMQLLPKSAQVQAGRIIWQGHTVLSDLSERAMNSYRGRRIGMIFQEPLSSLNPVMRCGEQIAESLRLHQQLSKAAAKTQTLRWLAKVQLRDPARVWKAFPHELSGGQRQRVMIAMALCNEPDLLIADEPTTALDVSVQRTILDLLKNLQADLGLTMLFISHDLGVIRELADQVLVMRHGKVVERGRMADVLQQARAAYTRGLLACRPSLSRRLYRLPVIADFEDQPAAKPAELLLKYREPPQVYTERQATLASRPSLMVVENLSVWFPKAKNWLGQPTDYVKAVDEVSLQIRQGERLGLVGESGSGKTTLGRALLRLSEARSGRIIYQGQDILSLSAKALRPLRPQLQMVFQDPFTTLNPRHSIGRMLHEPLAVYRKDLSKSDREARVLALLERVGLERDVLERKPAAFSGGQRQRIGIARALLLEPRLLVCDESVSALDVSVQAQVLNLLKDLQEAFGFSMLFITHDLGVVKFIADRVAVMQQGKIVEAAAVETLFADPQEEYTQRLLRAVLA
ncbi:MAG: ABC transporter ATP-binding protein [Bacteroidetes bacterium]|nr:MAG: ABC transporter ATP-binding protein [Bacteroidota bacterium]